MECRERVTVPERAPTCALCGAAGAGVQPAGFRQFYPQANADPLAVTWWECESCRGWFACPIPPIAAIERHWGVVDYSDEARAETVAAEKRAITSAALRGLADRVAPGRLLDVGCNFGHFILQARARGWHPTGFEVNVRAARTAQDRGLDVRCGWDLDDAGFGDATFDAISAIDVFCYAPHPNRMLRRFHRLLRPDGVLVMRLSNKRAAFGLVRTLIRDRERRDQWITRVLQNQFHAIGVRRLARVLRQIGFARIAVEPAAPVTSFTRHPRTHVAYLVARWIQRLSLGSVDVTPGVLLFAQKSCDGGRGDAAATIATISRGWASRPTVVTAGGAPGLPERA